MSTSSSFPCPIITCISLPMPVSDSNSWISKSRHAVPLIAYSEPPERKRVREIVTSEKSIGSAPSVLSMVRLTSARPNAGREAVPAKMTSAIFPPRKFFAPCSPITHVSASTTFDLPEPFGPTTQLIPGSKRSVVDVAKLLKPRRVRVFKYTDSVYAKNCLRCEQAACILHVFYSPADLCTAHSRASYVSAVC
ncbi:Uncharacterised protein [Chlamydia trachomatis]|nr:Uncharacterised protein [Chlamydia trachomatis]